MIDQMQKRSMTINILKHGLFFFLECSDFIFYTLFILFIVRKVSWIVVTKHGLFSPSIFLPPS